MATECNPKSKVDVFERSYKEVLSVLKHQDDKLNRTLTALAFLTVAGVSLFPRVDGQATFGGVGPEVPTVFFVVFLIAVALGVVVTLTAIGPSRPLPNSPSSSAHRDPPESLIYYAAISRDPKWDEKKSLPPKELTDMLMSNFHGEARAISHRVNYKIARSREANAWVQLVIVSLALMGIFGALDLSLSSRWWIAVGLLFVTLIIPFWELWQMRKTGFAQGDFSSSAYWILLAIVSSAVTLLVVGYLIGAEWQALGYAVVAFMVPRYAIVRSEWARWLLVTGLLLLAPAATLSIFLAR